MDNGQLQGIQSLELASLMQNQLGGHKNWQGPPNAEDSAKLFATDEGWRNAFLAALTECRQEIEDARDAAVTEANTRLKALEGILPKAPVEPPGAPAPKVSKTPLNDAARLAMALEAVKLAGKEGIASRTLGGILGMSAGPVVKPLIDAKKIRQKGTAGATRYYAA